MDESIKNTLKDAGVKFLRFIWCDNANVIRAKAAHMNYLNEYAENGFGITVDKNCSDLDAVELAKNLTGLDDLHKAAYFNGAFLMYDTAVVRGYHGEIGSSAAARGTPVLFAMFPRILKGEWTADSHPDRILYGKIARAAADLGLEVLDLTSVLAVPGVDWSRWWATRDDHHPNAAAHDLIARAIATRITERWLHPWLGPVEPPSGGATGF